MSPESAELKRQRELAQRQLIDFLQADLDLAFTMLQTAEIASDPAHTRSALRHVSEALATIRQLLGRVEDPKAWKAIHEQANELEKELESFRDGDENRTNQE